MNWRLKAAVQRACAALPVGGASIYYSVQRTFGQLRDPKRPMWMLRIAARLARAVRAQGVDLHGKRVFELGTGWRVDMPIGLYLAGARSTVTYDLHRYLKPRLVMEAVAVFARQRQAVLETFADLTDPEELERRMDAITAAPDIRTLFRIAGIEYRAPADATQTGQPAGSVDIHMSFTVLQHIPYRTLLALLREASRVLSPTGLAWHHVDLADQFALSDPSISRVNFLRFTDAEWARYSNNRFSYHNRLRAPDYKRLLAEAGHEIVDWRADVDERSSAELAKGFPLAAEFRGLPIEALAVDTLEVISRPMR